MNTQPAATPGTVCNPELFQFPAVQQRQVAASFSGGAGTSAGGLPLLRQLDRRLGLTQTSARGLPDPRDPALIEHSQPSLRRPRRYGLCHGYEDRNDHAPVRLAPAWQTAVEQIKPLASSPTLCRLENRADRAAAWARHGIVKAEHTAKGSNPRFLVTNLTGAAQELYDEVYCARGEMENRIKEQPLGLFADRTSCHDGWANQFRLWLAGFADVRLERLRTPGLARTERARAPAETSRLKLLKIGAVVLRHPRRIQRRLSRRYPYQRLFGQVAQTVGRG